VREFADPDDPEFVDIRVPALLAAAGRLDEARELFDRWRPAPELRPMAAVDYVRKNGSGLDREHARAMLEHELSTRGVTQSPCRSSTRSITCGIPHPSRFAAPSTTARTQGSSIAMCPGPRPARCAATATGLA